MDAESTVLVTDHDAVRLITLNRPDARNALSGDLISALYQHLRDADADDAVRAVVLTGSDPAFCAGVDLKQAEREGATYFARFETENCVAQVAAMKTPVIGAINGAAFTGGMEIALGCDFLVASERAVFADTHARVGILPGGGMTVRLPTLVGHGMARRLSMTSEVVDAARALEIGLVTEVVPHEHLLERAVALAQQVAVVPGHIMAGLKEIYVTGSAPTLAAAHQAEKDIAGRLFAVSDLGERRQQVASHNRQQIANHRTPSD
ncbi:MAG: enoyl-CoA hydratase [Aeromicrobium sp.]|nr:enoyl-CoA hydratase [Aeromicrobium sp.]